MNLMKWNPTRDLTTIQTEVNRLFEDFFGRSPWWRGGELADHGYGWQPNLDIHETKDSFIVEVELPGVKQEDVSISIANSTLVLKGEKRQEEEVKDDNYHRVERSYGSFQRAFALPSTVQGENTKAVYKDGILTITIPKSEAAKPKEVKIEVK